MAHIVTVEADRVVVYDMIGNTQTTVATAAELVCHFNTLSGKPNNDVYFSSTMDFPEDSTRNPSILSLVREINGEFERSVK